MKQTAQFIITLLVGFGASAITGGAPFVLLILLTLLAAGGLFSMSLDLDLDLTLKLPDVQLGRSLTQVESSTPQSTQGGFVLGVGHR